MELKGKKINFLGDSITEGCGVSAKENTFIEILKEKYNLAEARNYGKGGTRIARQSEIKDPNEPRDKDFLMRMWDMDPDADIVVVFGGTNDYGNGQAPLGTVDDTSIFTFFGAGHGFSFATDAEKYDKAVRDFVKCQLEKHA